eukprot:c18465_g1_i1.p1 GENE.c18465_g1_i1~~c18465_g1_i1.p1  ORF type:complete len:195 (-),score=45.37 c18465_g1_i1:33-617(-)
MRSKSLVRVTRSLPTSKGTATKFRKRLREWQAKHQHHFLAAQADNAANKPSKVALHTQHLAPANNDDVAILQKDYRHILPSPGFRYGWLGEVAKRPNTPPNYIVISHTVTNEELMNVLFKLWKFPHPDSIIQIVGISANDVYDQSFLNVVDQLLVRSVMKRKRAWFITEGGKSKISELLGKVAGSPDTPATHRH